MGGFGSGKGFRYGFRRGKGRVRRYTKELPFIDHQEIDFKKLDINNPYAELPYHGGTAYLKMKPHILPNASVWYSFECFYCKKGARRLYFQSPKLGCRKCLHLAYLSENRGKTDRAIDMKWKLVERIDKGYGDCPLRPKGMHRNTYDCLMERIAEYDRQSWARFFGCGPDVDPYKLVRKHFPSY